MPTWLMIIITVTVIGGIIGLFSPTEKDESKSKNAVVFALLAAVIFGQVLLYIFLFGDAEGNFNFITAWLFKVIFC